MIRHNLLSAGLVGLLCGSAFAAEKPASSGHLVQQALQSETLGESQSRDQLLKSAAQSNDKARSPRWQLGQVQWNGQWMQYKDLPIALGKEKDVTQYRAMRKVYPMTYAGQLQLANWCQKHGLPLRERVHLIAALELSKNPNDPVLRKRLGQKLVNGEWVDEKERSRNKALDPDFQRRAKLWRVKIKRLAVQRRSRRKSIADKAVKELAAIHDPAALPAMESVFGNAGLDDARFLVRLLGPMKTWRAARVLARLALISPWKVVRKDATAMLRTRKIEAFVPGLIASLQTPVDSRVALMVGNGGVHLFHYAENETQTKRHALAGRFSTIIAAVPQSGDRSVAAQQRARAKLARATQNAVTDAGLKAYNAQRNAALRNKAIEEWNASVCAVLAESTGVKLPADPEKWWEWWRDYNQLTNVPKEYEAEYYYQTRLEAVPVSEPTIMPLPQGTSVQMFPSECLVAGTKVWTDRGFVAVEDVRVGDLALAKDPETGELSYRPVLRTTVRQPEPTFRVTTSKGTIRGTGGHTFWISGRGWTKLRDVKPGQRFHGATGPVDIVKLEKTGKEKTYNLVVEGFHSYFVGEAMVLSHDLTFARPTDVTVPGLDPLASAKSTRSKRAQ